MLMLDSTVLETELNTNYLSIVTLIRYFAPHFMQLSVRDACMERNHKLIAFVSRPKTSHRL